MRKLTLTQQIALAGLLCAGQVVLVVAGVYFFGGEIVLVLIFPTITALYVLLSAPRQVFAYVIASLCLCALVDLTTTILWVLPTLIAGLLWGVVTRVRASQYLAIMICGSANYLLFLATNYIMDFYFHANVIELFEKLDVDSSIVALILLLFAFAQAFITSYMLQAEVLRLGLKPAGVKRQLPFWILPVITYGLAFLPQRGLAFVFSLLTAGFLVPLIIPLYKEKRIRQPLLIVQALLLLVALPLMVLIPFRYFYLINLWPFVATILIVEINRLWAKIRKKRK